MPCKLTHASVLPSETVISQRTCVQELELNLISYLLFRGSKLIGFERLFDLDLITGRKL